MGLGDEVLAVEATAKVPDPSKLPPPGPGFATIMVVSPRQVGYSICFFVTYY